MRRASGILMPVFSLPGSYSCGSFGKSAYEFIDFLKESGFTYWQTLPLGIPDSCNSPYSSYSSFLGNPAFIDPGLLYESGLVTSSELSASAQSSPYRCEYRRLGSERLELLKKAAIRFNDRNAVADFIYENPEIYSACRFMALKEENHGACWSEWAENDPDPEILYVWEFTQYMFMLQWNRLHEYASASGIKIIGDLPFYVSYDSSDVWSDRSQFLLSSDYTPESVAGVPPDYFSADGQLWNNPLYNWDSMQKDGYKWWMKRFSYMFRMFDGIRIDHFRAIAEYWSIPYGSATARSGKWIKGPGHEFIDTVKKAAGNRIIIAENLGIIDNKVTDMLDYSGFPGMSVLQFAFDGNPGNSHLPHNYSRNLVAYTGTHDNNTLLGFMWELPENTRKDVLEYIGYAGDNWDRSYEALMRLLLLSSADTVIFPIQDILGYGADTRINTPGTVTGNWEVRFTDEQLRSIDRNRLLKMNKMYGR